MQVGQLNGDRLGISCGRNHGIPDAIDQTTAVNRNQPEPDMTPTFAEAFAVSNARWPRAPESVCRFRAGLILDAIQRDPATTLDVAADTLAAEIRGRRQRLDAIHSALRSEFGPGHYRITASDTVEVYGPMPTLTAGGSTLTDWTMPRCCWGCERADHYATGLRPVLGRSHRARHWCMDSAWHAYLRLRHCPHPRNVHWLIQD